jgi:hypothetical protein
MKSTTLPDNILRRMEPSARKSLGKSGRTSEEIDAKKSLELEKEIHRQIDQWLRSKNIVFQHERMDGKTRGTVGWPDFTFVWFREPALEVKHLYVPIGCEVKRQGEKPTDDQAKIHDHMRRNGWTVLVVHSLQELIEELKKL